MKYRHLFFDLDGTLTDPGLGITNSVMHALRRLGIEETDRTKLYSFIGPPLRESFAKYYGIQDWQQAIAYYREYFAETGIFENEVYPGIEEFLAAAKKAGYVLCVSSSKPEPFVERILEHFRLRKYFSVVAGATMDEKIDSKEAVLAMAIERAGADKASSVIIGDRRNDIEGGHFCGIDAIGVLWGYGSREELETAGADRLVATIGELSGLFYAPPA